MDEFQCYASAIEPRFTMERIEKSCVHNNNLKITCAYNLSWSGSNRTALNSSKFKQKAQKGNSNFTRG